MNPAGLAGPLPLPLRVVCLPCSVFVPGGFMPPGTTAIEQRTIASKVPTWDSSHCTQCNICAFVCPHAAIRPVSAPPPPPVPAQARAASMGSMLVLQRTNAAWELHSTFCSPHPLGQTFTTSNHGCSLLS